MKILILAPWFRTLAQSHANALRSLGHDVRIVTTASQQNRLLFDDRSERLLNPKLRHKSNLAGLTELIGVLAHWRADICILDATWDPRFVAISKTAKKTMCIVHDPRPHDQSHNRRGWKKISESYSVSSADAIGCFSEYSRSQIDSNLPKIRLSLASEIRADLETSVRKRSGFAFVGRVSEYKGIEHLLDAWHLVRGQIEISDKLYILGSGATLERELDCSVRLSQGTYSDHQVSRLLSEVKALVLPYRAASQSGVQVAAFQFGAPTIVTRVGALPEFQPPGHPVLDVGDIDSLANTLVSYSKATNIERLSQDSKDRYRTNHSAKAVSDSFEKMLQTI